MNKKCQVFTPEKYAKKLLNSVGYKKNLYGKKVAENSCGDGNILSIIVERYIVDSIKAGIPLNKIRHGLELDIYGSEIDSEHRKNCIIRLDVIAQRYNIKKTKWNIFLGDFLKQGITDKFDYVIGNPPYITYLELDVNTRKYLKANYEVCNFGKFDYCYAFIEASIKSLKKDGRLAYLIPGNIFKNQFANSLREYIKPNLTNIYDYTSSKLFKDKLTSSAIIIWDKNKNNKNIKYHNVVDKTVFSINKKLLVEKWQFSTVTKSNQTMKFGDFFHAASSIATLLNKAFIISDFKVIGNNIHAKEFCMENEVLRKAVSPRSLNYNKDEYIIFPYYYQQGNLMKYSEKEFGEKFPVTVKYLKQYEKQLSERDSDNGSAWFEYGRSQALWHLNQQKLLISTLITNEVKVYLLDKNTIPTSGLYITPKNKYGLDIAKKILESKEFSEYVENIGVISNGSSFRISPRDINAFTFESRWLD